MEFPGFLGNRGVKEALSAAFSLRRFPHAVILQGEDGCGKRTLAGLIARALVCRNRDRAPCGVCPSCVRALAGSHPDIRVIEGGGAAQSLTVDAVKTVAADAYRKPEEAEVSVYILFMGARPAEAAQNKLLKVIEEPPEGAVFLLVCRSAELLLPTIRSRAQCFTLLPPSLEEAAAWARERAGMPPEEARRLADLCGGNLGRMLEEQEGGDAARALEIAAALAKSAAARDGDGLFRSAAPLQKDRKLCRDTLIRLELIFRDACVLRSGGTRLLGQAPEEARGLSRLPKDKLYALPGVAEEFLQALDRNANMSLLTTGLCLRILDGGR